MSAFLDGSTGEGARRYAGRKELGRKVNSACQRSWQLSPEMIWQVSELLLVQSMPGGRWHKSLLTLQASRSKKWSNKERPVPHRNKTTDKLQAVVQRIYTK